ncbi:MAG TPA: MmcQ/YjbR family DNA-binding protein [Phototrophicaceae bacterium]|nr:MmcQ/YjbR family DNA-binding protein [Phototrophicaceae bacterium]
MSEQPLDRLRYICMALPEAVEDTEGVGSPAYKVNAKIFAMHHPMNDRPSLWCKAQKGFQEVIVANEPERFFVPPYVGQHGWIGIYLDVELDWDLIADFIEDSYRMSAPKRLIKLLPIRS